MTKLSVEGLYKGFATQAVLTGIDLVVPDGSLTALLGPSGSGKTTLLRVIAGFDRADSGSVILGESVVDDGSHYIPPDRRRIGYVPQEGSLFPHLTVEKNIAFGVRDRVKRKVVAEHLLSVVGLSGFGRRYPHQLSGGQQQRVALARALAIEPEIVLLDEPFSSLDASLRTVVRTDVCRILRETNTTAILVTHDQDEALSLADQVAIIRDGQIRQSDTPQALYARPESADLARLLGETNFVAGVANGDTVETVFGPLPLENGPISDRKNLTVLVRPEQIVLDQTGNGTGLSGQVEACEFYGHDAVVRIRRTDDPKEVLIVRTAGNAAFLEPGTPVRLRVSSPVRAWIS